MLNNLNGLIIREVNYGDNDKIVTILTDKLGKISAGVLGGRSIKSKKAAGCQLFCYSKFALVQKGNRYTVSQVQVMESFYKIREQVETVSLAYYIAQLCESVVQENIESSDVLRLTLNTLYLLTQKDVDVFKIKSVYELRLLSVIGQMPNLVCCKECGCYEGALYFLLDEGCLLCKDCKGERELPAAIALNSGVLTALRYIVFSEDKKVHQFHLNEENTRFLNFVTEQYAIYRLDRTFSTLDFFKDMTNMK